MAPDTSAANAGSPHPCQGVDVDEQVMPRQSLGELPRPDRRAVTVDDVDGRQVARAAWIAQPQGMARLSAPVAQGKRLMLSPLAAAAA